MSVRARLRALGRNPGLVIGATIGVLLVVVPCIVLAALVATGHTGDVGGLVFLVMLLAGGCYVCFVCLRQAGAPSAPKQVVVTDSTGLYGVTVTIPEPTEPAEPPRSPWRVVGGLLAVLVVVSVAFAIVMSVLDDYLFGRPLAARIVVQLLVLVITIGVTWVLRRLIGSSPGRHRSSDRR